MEKQKQGKKEKEILEYRERVNALRLNLTQKQKFSPRLIANSAFNARLAEQNLTKREYELVLLIYSFYANSNEYLELSYAEWQEIINYIMSSYDLVAPFYKFGGIDDGTEAQNLEKHKQPYRNRAIELLEKGEIATVKWTGLVKEFQEKFGKNI